MRFWGDCRDKIKADKLKKKKCMQVEKIYGKKNENVHRNEKIRSIILVCAMVAGIILAVPGSKVYADFTEQQDSTTTSQNEQTTKSTEMTSPQTTKDDSEEWSFALLAVFSTVFLGYIVIRRKINKLDELE